MRAARIHTHGGPEQLRVEEVRRPSIGKRDVLIEVHASSVNPIDWKMRRGVLRAVLRSLPQILGIDASGVVVEKGADVTRFDVGDEVYTSPPRPGTYAEYVAVHERAVARKPSNISHEQAAGIPLAGLTAWQCLVDAGRIEAGHKVFIQAGAGGVGSLAIQIAKHFGASVATTCSPRNVELVRRLGADVVIDYTKQSFDEVLEGYDIVLDALGGEQKRRAKDVLVRGGRLVSIVNDMPGCVNQYGPYLGLVVAFSGVGTFKLGCMLKGLSASYVVRRADADALAQMARLIEEGAIEPVVDRVIRLDEIVEAHRYSESGRARGKIIIAMKEPAPSPSSVT